MFGRLGAEVMFGKEFPDGSAGIPGRLVVFGIEPSGFGLVVLIPGIFGVVGFVEPGRVSLLPYTLNSLPFIV